MDTELLRYNRDNCQEDIQNFSACVDSYKQDEACSGQSPFHSFWMAGFECTDKLNAFGNRVDFLHITGHLELIDEDYKRLHDFNIATVREGIRWSQVERTPYVYDWSTV